MRPIVLCSLLLAIALVTCVCKPTTVSAAGSWPRFRGPSANGMSPETGINKNWKQRPPKLLWKASLSDNGYSGPSVADGKVFIIDHKGDKDIVRALNITNGKDVWSYSYQDNSRPNYGFARCTPTYDGGKLYTLSRLGMVHCFDARTGKVLWSKNMQREFGGRAPSWQYSMSPFIDGNKLILCPAGNGAAVVALNKTNGQTIWKGGLNDLCGYATPVLATIGGKRQYVIFSGTKLSGVDANTGRVIWQFPWKTGCDVNAAAPLVIGSSVFITSGYKHGCAMVTVSGAGARAKWQNKEMQAHFSSPIYANGFIYGNSDPDHLVCLDPNTGRAKWKQSGFEKGGLIGVDGVIIALGGRTGDCVMVKTDPNRYQELGRFKPLGGQSWTAPVVAGGKLIVRNTKTLACYDLK